MDRFTVLNHAPDKKQIKAFCKKHHYDFHRIFEQYADYDKMGQILNELTKVNLLRVGIKAI